MRQKSGMGSCHWGKQKIFEKLRDPLHWLRQELKTKKFIMKFFIMEMRPQRQSIYTLEDFQTKRLMKKKTKSTKRHHPTREVGRGRPSWASRAQVALASLLLQMKSFVVF